MDPTPTRGHDDALEQRRELTIHPERERRLAMTVRRSVRFTTGFGSLAFIDGAPDLLE
jgi:hypothetical protein